MSCSMSSTEGDFIWFWEGIDEGHILDYQKHSTFSDWGWSFDLLTFNNLKYV